ncbi:MAG TPA: phosphatidylglycerol lysyltransferase domain-containing protein [Gaiellaceae bacterium]|nr:phosphatidylglycerol lysyltransferase domain-containing protein [Gaiellaceae bacterium]
MESVSRDLRRGHSCVRIRSQRARTSVVTRRGTRIEAFVACARVNGGQGWFLEDLVRRPTAPVGATELVVVEALARLANSGADWAALDIAPLRGSARPARPA